jgi:hypothetical protein
MGLYVIPVAALEGPIRVINRTLRSKLGKRTCISRCTHDKITSRIMIKERLKYFTRSRVKYARFPSPIPQSRCFNCPVRRIIFSN